MSNSLSRRQFFAHSSQTAAMLAAGAATVARPAQAAMGQQPTARYCLNTSTIRGHERPLTEEVQLVAAAGYDGIEPWIREIQQYVERGGSLPDLRKQIEDAGLTVDSAIGFTSWIVDDDAERAKGLEGMKRDMDLLRQIGGTRIAAPPAGATNQSDLNLLRAAERYAQLLELGRSMGVTPQLEVWGFSQSLSRLGEVMYVAVESGDADACILPDVYHIYKGGSDFDGLALIPGRAIQVMHLNDYPAVPARETIGDKDRVYPGDGVAPIPQIIRTLRDNGFAGTFSLELFNPEYWKQPIEQVLHNGLLKMQGVVAASYEDAGDEQR